MILPRLPSALIRLGINDLELVEVDPKYMVSMSNWHKPKGGMCYVCIAGAVMAKTMGVEPEIWENPAGFKEDYGALVAIDCLRIGRVNQACKVLGLECNRANVYIPEYADHPERFKLAMMALAKDLEEMGL